MILSNLLLRGLHGMVQKIIMCPNCKNKITIEGKPGEKVYVTCSKCNTNGFYSFPKEESILKTTINAPQRC